MHRKMVLSLLHQQFMLVTQKKMATLVMGRAAKMASQMTVLQIWVTGRVEMVIQMTVLQI